MLGKRFEKGNTITIIAPSGPVHLDRRHEIENFVNYVKEFDLKVKFSDNFEARDKYEVTAGTPKERADDLNSAFSNKDTDVVWCLQGGDCVNEILDLIDYDAIKKNPKLIMGKSDIDILLLAVNKMTDLITIHCCDPKIGSNKEMDFDYTKEWFVKRMFEGSKEIAPSGEWKCLREGAAEGKILGCNPTSILKLAGTKYFPDFTDSILFLEFYKSEPAEVVFQMTQLKHLGVLDKVKGIVVGHCFGFDSEFLPEDIVLEMVPDLPIMKIREFGHYQPHLFLPIGARVKMDGDNLKLEIIEEIVK